MDTQIKLALEDAKFWIDAVEKQLREMRDLSDSIDERLTELRSHQADELALDVNRLSNKASSTILRNQHIRTDVVKIEERLTNHPDI